MYDGVKAMAVKELELRNSDGLMCGPHLKQATDLVAFPKFPAGTKSLLSKFLTPEIWAKYKDVKDKHGFSFLSAIISGC